jgi:hypothetical protein
MILEVDAALGGVKSPLASNSVASIFWFRARMGFPVVRDWEGILRTMHSHDRRRAILLVMSSDPC